MNHAHACDVLPDDALLAGPLQDVLGRRLAWPHAAVAICDCGMRLAWSSQGVPVTHASVRVNRPFLVADTVILAVPTGFPTKGKGPVCEDADGA